MPKINRTGGPGTTRPAAPEGITAADQAAILEMIANEQRNGGDDFSPGRGAKVVTPKYMVRPPGPGGGGIVAKYMVVPPGIVPMYIAPAPWAGMDAHQAVINGVTADGKVSKKEAQLLRRLFNRDIAEAGKEGRDIHAKVASYLHKVLDRLQMDRASKNLIFGSSGPGYTRPPIVAKYMVVRPQ